jgi:hypothetical protein
MVKTLVRSDPISPYLVLSAWQIRNGDEAHRKDPSVRPISRSHVWGQTEQPRDVGKLCGDETNMNVILAAPKWSLTPDSKGVDPEKGREEKFRNKMMDHRATMARFEDTKEFACVYVDQIIKNKFQLMPFSYKKR